MRTFTTADVYLQFLNAPAPGAEVPNVCVISEQEVHVWTVELTRIQVLEEALSSDEKERAARLDSEEAPRRFRAAHSALRMILAAYLKLPHSSLVFGQTEFGKPFLINAEADGLLFNLSYAGNLAVIAVARDREVGIDIEPLRTESVSLDVAAQVFSVAEFYTLSGLNSEQQRDAFVSCWTRKQAYIKARGEGGVLAADQFDVSLAPGAPAAMLNNRIDKAEPARWIFQDLHIAPNYAGTLVIEAAASPPRLSYFAFGC